MGERIDLYQDNFIRTDLVVERGDLIPQDHYAMIVFIAIFNREGNMLIQRRQLTKKGWPGQWDISAAGAVSSGESSREAATREVKEELGVEVADEDFTKILTLHYETTIHDIYTLVADFSLEEIQIQEEEVMDVRYASRSEIEEMIQREEFIPVYKEFIALLFAMKDKKGILL